MRLPELPSGIRRAIPDDVDAVLTFVHELAEFEREPDAVKATADDLRGALFGDDRAAGCVIAEDGDDPVGFALFYRTFSTWTGRPGLHLEDLYVSPSHRGSGVGRRLIAALARIAQANDWSRVEWSVLDWNSEAIGFYESLGATAKSQWFDYRLDGDTLTSLAASD